MSCLFKGADCDTNRYLMIAKVRQKLSVSKRALQNFDMERFNLEKLNDVEVKERYEVKISNRFATLENLDGGDDMNISRARENIRENVNASATESVGYYELKQYKSWIY